MKAANIFTVGVVGLRPIPGVLLFSVWLRIRQSFYSLSGRGPPIWGRASARGALPILSIEYSLSMKLPPPLPLPPLSQLQLGYLLVQNLN